jgi:sugar lactone lactonase YvrE
MARAGVKSWLTDLANASYDNVSFDVGGSEANARGIFFRPTGESFYITGRDGDDITQFDMTTAWDITTASASFPSVGIPNSGTNPNGLWFKDDGLTFYVMDLNVVYEFTCSTAWDISTATYSSVSQTLSNNYGVQTVGMAFSEDGLKLYAIEISAGIKQYSLSTAWDITSATYDGAFGIGSQDGIAVELRFSPDGSKMYVSGISNDRIYQYSLSPTWDATSATYDNVFLSVGSQATSPLGMEFNEDGSKLYVIDRDSDKVYQYSTA